MVITRLTYQQSSILFYTSVRVEERDDNTFENENHCGKPDRPRRLLCHAHGGKSRPSAMKIIKEDAQPKLVPKNLVNQVVQDNHLTPSL
jgi:hypothetical protein